MINSILKYIVQDRAAYITNEPEFYFFEKKKVYFYIKFAFFMLLSDLYVKTNFFQQDYFCTCLSKYTFTITAILRKIFKI